jgi:hypothetical protein
MKTKLIATTAIAALAVPAAALAEKPSHAGSHGKAKAQQTKKPKGVGFTLGGVDVTGFSVTEGVVAPFSLDPTRANKHARSFFQPALTKEFIKGEDTVEVPVADGDEARVRYSGLSSTDALQPTDRIKVTGKVTKVKKGDTTTQRVLDIRKVVITRKAEKAEGPKAVAAANPNAPGQACKGQSKKKAEGQKKSAFAACVSGYKKQTAAENKAEMRGKDAPNPARTCAAQPKKKAEGQKKSLFAACVSGAKKAEKAAEQS